MTRFWGTKKLFSRHCADPQVLRANSATFSGTGSILQDSSGVPEPDDMEQLLDTTRRSSLFKFMRTVPSLCRMPTSTCRSTLGISTSSSQTGITKVAGVFLSLETCTEKSYGASWVLAKVRGGTVIISEDSKTRRLPILSRQALLISPSNIEQDHSNFSACASPGRTSGSDERLASSTRFVMVDASMRLPPLMTAIRGESPTNSLITPSDDLDSSLAR